MYTGISSIKDAAKRLLLATNKTIAETLMDTGFSENKIIVYTNEGVSEREVVKGTSHMREDIEFVEAIADDKPLITADVSSIYESMKLLFKIKSGK